MSHKTKTTTTLLFISLISCIYVLRDNNTSPIGFLQHHATRLLSSTTFSDALCDGVNRNDPITDSERSLASSLESALSAVRGGNPLVTFIESSYPSTEFGKEYGIPLLKFVIPWAVFFIISLVLCIAFSINWCCMYICSCGCRCCKQPKSSGRKKALVIATCFFMLATFAAGVAGIVVSSKFPSDGKQLICSAAVFLDKLLEGSLNDRWVGVKPAVTKLTIVLDNLDSVSTNIPLVAVSPTTTTGALYTTASATVTSMYTTYKDSTIARGDQTGSPSPYKPTYIQNLASTDASIGGTGAIQAELDAKSNALSDAYVNFTFAIPLLKTADFLLSATNDLERAKELCENITKNMTKLEDNVINGGSKGRTAMDAIGGGMLGVFAVQMLIAFISMVSIILIYRGALYLSKVLHISWCTLGFLVVLSWVLAVILFPLSVVFFEVCEVIERILVDQPFFNQTMDKFFNDTNKTNDDPDKNSTRDTLYRCIYGDGDLLNSSRSYIKVFEMIGYGLDATAPMDESAQTVVNSVQIPRQTTLVTQYEAGTVSDATEATTDLSTLNSYTNGDSCSGVKDRWIFASASCGSSDGTVFQSTSLPTYNVLSQTCIGFDVWSSTTTAIQTRYTSSIFSGCPSVNSKTAQGFRQDFVNDFKTSRTAVQNLFNNIEGTLSTNVASVKAANDAYMTAVKSYTANNIKDVRSAYDPLYQPLNNQTDGLLPNANCNFLKESLIDMEEKLCYRFAPTIFQVAITMIIIGFVALFGTIMTFCLAKKVSVDGELIKKRDSRGKYMSASQV